MIKGYFGPRGHPFVKGQVKVFPSVYGTMQHYSPQAGLSQATTCGMLIARVLFHSTAQEPRGAETCE